MLAVQITRWLRASPARSVVAARGVACVLSLVVAGCGGGGDESAADAEALVAAGWNTVFQDRGQTGDLAELWHPWGTTYTVTRGQSGMRVAGGPDVANNQHRVALWARVDLPPGDLRIAYDYTRHDTGCPACAPPARIGIASQLLLAVHVLQGAVPTDPVDVTVPDPSLAFINNNLQGMRLTYSTTYNPNPEALDQVRAHLTPGNIELLPASGNDFFFVPESTYHMVWQKAGKTITVEQTDPIGVVRTHSFTDDRIADRVVRRVALYHQPLRDASYTNFKVWHRRPS